MDDYINEITWGNSWVLTPLLPDGSVDLIFTDPLYERKDDYEWLASVASRVLKPEGALLVWSNGRWHYEHSKWLESYGMTYRWGFSVVHRHGKAPLRGKIISRTNRLLWFDISGSSKMVSYLPDGFLSKPWMKRGKGQKVKQHQFIKNPTYTRMAIRAFSNQDELVFDPFCGGGTIPACCVEMGRNFIAFEIDSDAVEIARKKLATTQRPLEGLNESLTVQAEWRL
jgi:DNA modification methylase